MTERGEESAADPAAETGAVGGTTVELSRREAGTEVVLVLGVSLGASAVLSLLNLVAMLTANKPLSQQHATLNQSITPDRPWLDLAFQLANILIALVPAALALHLLRRTDEPVWERIGMTRTRWLGDSARGAALALLIGLPGLALYFGARALGLNATVVAAGIGQHWWSVPVLVAAAVQNALLEEIVVVAYLLLRLTRLGYSAPVIIAMSAVLRGSYHLYQGFGGFVGNVVMGVVFAMVFLRTRRVMPLIIAHALLDIVAFVGYSLLKPYLSWLP